MMGMFDYVRCEVPLPDGFQTDLLQTKDFDPSAMVTHVITKDGRLMECVFKGREHVPKSERPYPDAPDDDFRSLIGSLRTISTMQDAKFHGMFNFYGIGEAGDWHEYNAKFTDGQLVEIVLVPAE